MIYYFFQNMGVALRAQARIQINLAVSQVKDIKQVETFPDIVFPIMWFEDVSMQFRSFLSFDMALPELLSKCYESLISSLHELLSVMLKE